jgi:endonuclease/exonuclease/phosphatase (EEP) superfamily protein YafD
VTRPTPRVSPRSPLFNGTRQLLAFALSLYLLALAAHLILRLLLGDRVRLLAIANLLTPFYFVPLGVILPLALLLRLRRVALMAGILCLIGLSAYAPRFIPRAVSAADGATISLATLNVYRRNPEVMEITQWLRQRDTDIVFMQELPLAVKDAALDGIEALYPYTYVEESNDGAAVTLSRLPIIAAESFTLTDPTRIQQRLIIEANGQPVVLYNMHLSNPIPERPMPWYRRDAPFLLHLMESYDDSQRDLEVQLLLQKIAAEQQPLIIAGDFNMSDQSGMYQEMAARLHDSFAEVGFGLGTTWPARDTEGLPAFVPPLLRLDYVWHNDSLISQNAAVEPSPGSDHLSVSVVLALPP